MKKCFFKITFIAGLALSSVNSLKAQSNLFSNSRNQTADDVKPEVARNSDVVALKAKVSTSEKTDSSALSKITYGIASFYAKYFEGAITATGEIFHNKHFTAASNNFKLNTWVRVSNLLNGKSIIVRINDRMHPRMAAKGRVVDLTVAAAQMLNFTSSGTTKVKVEVVPKGTTK